MSSLDDVRNMQQLVQLKYRQQQESFARLQMQEDKLRSSLRQLDVFLATSRQSEDTPQKAIGADVVWQGWIARKKHELNMQLAQVLAIKERHIAQVRKAYGKVLVTDELVSQITLDKTKEKAQSNLDRAINSMLF